jgi:hypothetical protein
MNRHLVIALLGAALLSCDPATANGTTFFVAVAWQDGWPIVALRFSGEAGTMPAFSPTTRPVSPNGTLSTPQTVRILLSDGLAGQSVDVTAEGLRADGGVFARGSAGQTVVQGREVNVMIELSQGGSGGGAGTGGSGMGGGTALGGGSAAGGGVGPTGGGAALGGGPAGGGTATTGCACATGCCMPSSTKCAELNGNFFTCPKAAMSTCTVACDGFTSDSCGQNGACACGSNPPCGAGLRCQMGLCVCDQKSGCDGCCDGSDTCVPRLSQMDSKCGAAGISCVSCGGVACVAGVCGALVCPGANTCRSGNECPVENYPTCQGPGGVACAACNPGRTDRCSPTHQCACGDGGECIPGEVCLASPDGGVQCRPVSG